MAFPLTPSDPTSLGLDSQALDRLYELINRHIAEGRYPGAQIAVARHGKLALLRQLRRRADRPAARGGEGRHAVAPLLEHQGRHRLRGVAPGRAGRAVVHRHGAAVRARLRGQRQGRHHAAPGADPPGRLPQRRRAARRPGRTTSCCAARCAASRSSGRRARASTTTAAPRTGRRRSLIEALTKTDYRAFIRDNVIEPLGLGDELFVGAARRRARRARSTCTSRRRTAAARSSAPRRTTPPSAGPACRAAAATRPRAAWPRSTRCSSQGGKLNGTRLLSPRMVAVRHAQLHRRPRRRLHGHADAPRARAARARPDRHDPGAGRAGVAAHVRARRRGLVLLLGRSRTRACPSPTSPTAACRIHGTALGST